MDQPLTVWYCDVCGDRIAAKDGYVVWKTTDDLKSSGFKIIHQGRCDRRDYPASAALSDFLGPEGVAQLLAFLSLGPIKRRIGQKPHADAKDMDEFVDFFRRVQTPYYEEARRLFHTQEVLDDYYDSNEVAPYLPDYLESMIKKHGGR
jgi:hypothetical protein